MALTLKLPPNNVSENTSVEVVCGNICFSFLTYVNVEVNSVDPYQTALIAEV